MCPVRMACGKDVHTHSCVVDNPKWLLRSPSNGVKKVASTELFASKSANLRGQACPGDLFPSGAFAVIRIDL